ncbi:MAG: DUF362 domain-containing protein [Bacteroidales bacterium]|nr:DUF362 domain-containing protein [Bacteroidales bacterium]
MKKLSFLLLAAFAGILVHAQSTVFFTSEITPESLVKIYKALGVSPQGNVAIKISTGESMQSNYLRPEFIKDLVVETHATLVECNTTYSGNRSSTASHKKAIEERGFTAIADVDIMDEEGDMEIPMADTSHLKVNTVGSHLKNYDFMINLAHFKGHAMGGFGGVIKNQSIGIASRRGKALIHSAGRNDVSERWYNYTSDQDGFLECMAAAAQAVHNYFGEGKIIYINVMNNLSVDCDCDGHPHAPQMNDIGILASTDPVALDKACLDLVFNHQSTSADNAQPLINRITQRHGTHTVEYAEKIGLGSQQYTLVNIDDASIEDVNANTEDKHNLRYNVFTIDGKKVLTNAKSLDTLPSGVYIINGQKKIIAK